MIYTVTDTNVKYLPLWAGCNNGEFKTVFNNGVILTNINTCNISWAYLTMLTSGRDDEELDISFFDYNTLKICFSIRSNKPSEINFILRKLKSSNFDFEQKTNIKVSCEWKKHQFLVKDLYKKESIGNIFFTFPKDLILDLEISDFYFICDKNIDNDEKVLFEKKNPGYLIIKKNEIKKTKMIIEDKLIVLCKKKIPNIELNEIKTFIDNRYYGSDSNSESLVQDEIINSFRYTPEEGNKFYTFREVYCKIKTEEHKFYKRIYLKKPDTKPIKLLGEDKISLFDLTVILAVRIDSTDRMSNINYIIYFYEKYYINYRIILIEHGQCKDRVCDKFSNRYNLKYFHLESNGCFHKSRILNYGLSLAKTTYVIMHDVDVFFKPNAIPNTLKTMRESNIKFMFPYNNVMLQIRKKVFENDLDFNNFFNQTIPFYDDEFVTRNILASEKNDLYVPLYGDSDFPCTGGAIVVEKEALIECGGYNENIISYSCEDTELTTRLRILGHDIYRLGNYNCYHLEHTRGLDSLYNNYYTTNHNEFQHVQAMSKMQLKHYVDNKFRKIEFTHDKQIKYVNDVNNYTYNLNKDISIDMSTFVFSYYVQYACHEDKTRLSHYIKHLNDKCKGHSIVIIESNSRLLSELYCNENVQYEYRNHYLETKEILEICLSKTSNDIISIWDSDGLEENIEDLNKLINGEYETVFEKLYEKTFCKASFFNSRTAEKFLRIKLTDKKNIPCSLIVTTYADDVIFTKITLENIKTWKKPHHELIVIYHDATPKLKAYLAQNKSIDQLIEAPSNNGHTNSVNLGASRAHNDILINIANDIIVSEVLIDDTCKKLYANENIGLIGWHYDWAPYMDGTFWEGNKLLYRHREHNFPTLIESWKSPTMKSHLDIKTDHTKNITNAHWFTGKVFKAIGEQWLLSFNGSFFGIKKNLWNEIEGFSNVYRHIWADDFLQYAILDKGYDVINLDYDIRVSNKRNIFKALDPSSKGHEQQSTNHAIFSVVNQKFFVYCISFLNSMEKNWPNHPEILLHYSDLDDASKVKLQTYEKVRLIEDNGHGIPGDVLSKCHHPVVFNRLNLWSDQFNQYDNILHLDVDILVLRSLDALLEKDEFFIVDNKGEMFHDTYSLFDNDRIYEKDFEVLDMLEKDGLCFPIKMANAGVFMIPKKYRNAIRHKEIIDLLEKYKDKIAYADQSIISIWCAKNCIPISDDVQFNYQPRFYRLPKIIKPEDASLIHFTSPNKPGTKGFENWWIINGKRNYYLSLYDQYKAY